MQRIRPFLALAFLLVAARVGPPADPAELRLIESKKLLEAGKGEEALAQAQEGLEFSPDHFGLLHIAAQSASAAQKKDEAIWYGSMALGQTAALTDAKTRQKTIDELEALVAAADPLQQKGRGIENEYAQALLKIGSDLARRQMWVSAVGILTRLRGTAVADKAEAELAKVYDNKK